MNLLTRLVRVALVAVKCHEPAAHDMSDFGFHSDNTCCTCCKIQEVLQKPESYDPEARLFLCVVVLSIQFKPSRDRQSKGIGRLGAN